MTNMKKLKQKIYLFFKTWVEKTEAKNKKEREAAWKKKQKDLADRLILSPEEVEKKEKEIELQRSILTREDRRLKILEKAKKHSNSASTINLDGFEENSWAAPIRND